MQDRDIPRLADVVPQAHLRLLRLGDRATAFEPAARFDTAEEMRREIEDYLAEVGDSVEI